MVRRSTLAGITAGVLNKIMEQKYRMRVVRGAFVDPKILDDLGAKTIEKFEREEWIGIDEVICDLEQVKELQKAMVKHYDDISIPWYMDGDGVEDKNNIIVAFGADDGKDGKIFQFKRGNKQATDEVVRYGISKGIPAEQMDFMDVKF